MRQARNPLYSVAACYYILQCDVNAAPSTTRQKDSGRSCRKTDIRAHVLPFLQRRQQLLRPPAHVPHAVLPEEKPGGQRATATGRAAFAAHEVDERIHAQDGVAFRDLEVLRHHFLHAVMQCLVALEPRAPGCWGIEFGGEATGSGDDHPDFELLELDGESLRVRWERGKAMDQ